MGRPNQFTNPWTDEQVELLQVMIEQGYDNHEIGERLGRTAKSISIKRGRLNINRVRSWRDFKDKAWLEKKYIDEQYSTVDIAEVVGVSPSCIARWLQQLGIKARDFNLVNTKRQNKKIGESLSKIRGERHHAWKGGKSETREGYVYVKAEWHPNANANGSVLEHRLVIEDSIGRFLLPTEVVHHKNKVTNDNRLENLHLFKTSNDHRFYHYLENNNVKVELQYEYQQSGFGWAAYKRSRIALFGQWSSDSELHISN